MITYKVEDAGEYPICFGNTEDEAIRKAKEWIKDYPHMMRRPFRLTEIKETPLRILDL